VVRGDRERGLRRGGGGVEGRRGVFSVFHRALSLSILFRVSAMRIDPSFPPSISALTPLFRNITSIPLPFPQPHRSQHKPTLAGAPKRIRITKRSRESNPQRNRARDDHFHYPTRSHTSRSRRSCRGDKTSTVHQ